MVEMIHPDYRDYLNEVRRQIDAGEINSLVEGYDLTCARITVDNRLTKVFTWDGRLVETIRYD